MGHTLIVIPPEPIETKEFYKELGMKNSGQEIYWYALTVWNKKRVPSFLWRRWKPELDGRGYTWQKFQKLLSFHDREAILWMSGHLTWEKYVQILINSIEGPFGELLVTQKDRRLF